MTLKDILGEPITRKEAMNIILQSELAYEKFCELEEQYQEDLLEFVQGKKGLPILYDGFYKYVLDPERNPERLEDFLTELFGQKVVIEQVLAKEGNKLADEGSLVVMDIIVRLSDGSIVDVEMQKHGYLFTGQRSSCYLSDMIELVERYPEFIECYHDIREFRRNPEELINMFSEALIQMDKNTVKYMIEEQQKELEENKKELEENARIIAELRKELENSKNKDIKIQERDVLIKDQAVRIAELEAALKQNT